MNLANILLYFEDFLLFSNILTLELLLFLLYLADLLHFFAYRKPWK